MSCREAVQPYMLQPGRLLDEFICTGIMLVSYNELKSPILRSSNGGLSTTTNPSYNGVRTPKSAFSYPAKP